MACRLLEFLRFATDLVCSGIVTYDYYWGQHVRAQLLFRARGVPGKWKSLALKRVDYVGTASELNISAAILMGKRGRNTSEG